jgi:MFS family permease
MRRISPPDRGAEADRKARSGVLAAACVSALVVNANTSAVTILLPSISKDVGAPVAQLQWAVTGYSLVGAAVIVTAGALGDVFGRRKVFLGGLALFIASCALIALSTSAAGVVGGRMIQGASGATILACGTSLLSVAASGAGQLKAITLCAGRSGCTSDRRRRTASRRWPRSRRSRSGCRPSRSGSRRTGPSRRAGVCAP